MEITATTRKGDDWGASVDEDDWESANSMARLDERFPVTGHGAAKGAIVAEKPRRFIKKFGDAKNDQNVTFAGEEVTFELTSRKKKEETWITLDDKGEKVVWGATAKEPSKFMLRLNERTQRTEEPWIPDAKNESNVYRPPSRRNDEEATLKVSNLSDTIETQDLYELFDRFGSIQRVHMVRRRGEFIGVAYVSFVRRDCAVEAMARLNGHRYDHLILAVEWAQPRSEKEH